MNGQAAIDCSLGGLALPERLAAALAAGQLTRWLEFLTWTGRAERLDAFFWSEAKARLRHELITAVINRRVGNAVALAEIAAFTRYARAVLTAALVGLDEPVQVDSWAVAMTYRFSLLPTHNEAAEAWMQGREPQDAELELARHPGFAFLLLSLSPSDSAESFMARDAFFAAMLGPG